MARFRDELDRPDFPFAWHGDDLVAALIIRDKVAWYVARGVAVPLDVAQMLADADALFTAITEEDARGAVIERAALHGVEPGPGWWWSRIPVRGLARIDLDSNGEF